MKNKILFIIIILKTSTIFSQQTIIYGDVYSDNKNKIEFFDVLLLNPSDSTVLAGEFSNNGYFKIVGEKNKNYLVQISSLGYKKIHINTSTNTNDSLYIGKTTLSSEELNEIVVMGHRPVIKRKNGKLIVDIKNSSIKNAPDINGVIKKMPGVIIDKSKEIMVIGRGAPLIYINDREIFSRDELENIKPADIDKIEIIRNPDSRYSASGNAVINIKTKQFKEDIFNASINTNSYLSNKNFSNISDISINNKYKNLLNHLSYKKQYWNTTELESFIENRQYSGDSVFVNKGNSSTDSKNLNDNFLWGGEYVINKKNKISALASFAFFDKTEASSSIQEIKNFNDFLYTRKVDTPNELERKNKTLGLNFIHEQDSTNKLSVALDYTNIKSNGNSKVLESEERTTNKQQINVNNETDYDVCSGKIDYELSKNNFDYSFGIHYSKVKNNSSVEQYTNDVAEYKIATHINDQLTGAYFQVARSFEFMTVSSGIRIENTQTDNKIKLSKPISIDTSYFNFFPNAQLEYTFNENFISTFSYSRKINRPSFNEINPQKIYHDSLSYAVGNPFVKPSFVDNFELSINLFSDIDLSLSYSHTNDKRVQVALNDEHSKEIIKYTYININSFSTYTLNLDYSYYGDWYSLYSSIGVIKPYAKIPYLDSDIKINKPISYISVTNEFVINRLTLYVDFSYESSGNTDLSYYKSSNYFSAGAYISFFKDNLFIILTINDIFNTDKTQMRDKFRNLYIETEAKEDTRRVELSLTYKFNNFKQIFNRKDSNSEIMKRIN